MRYMISTTSCRRNFIFILDVKTVTKSSNGMLKNNNTGAKELYIVYSLVGFQSNNILIKPNIKPINKLPESPM